MKRLIVLLIVLIAASALVTAERSQKVFRINHGMGNLMKKHLLERGWVDGKKEDIKNADWIWSRKVKKNGVGDLRNPEQIHNKFLNCRAISNKTDLIENLKNLYERERSFDLWSFFPRAYVINSTNDSHDLEKFLADFKRIAGEKDEKSEFQPLPSQTIDGTGNVWIMKPESGEGGKGIKLMSTLKEFYDYKESLGSKGFVVQKYLEEPLLINGKKFDIRQHILVARKNPLVIFIRDNAVFKLSQYTYDLNNTADLFLHLTNYNFQLKGPGFDKKNAFWSLQDFKDFASNDLNRPNVWEERIQPKIDEMVIAAIRSWPDAPGGERENSFMLLGIDVMIDKEFNPYLLEVNTYPGLGTSAPIQKAHHLGTARDLVKVMLDAREEWEKPGSPRADPDHFGSFRLIYSDVKEGYQPGLQQSDWVKIALEKRDAYEEWKEGTGLSDRKHHKGKDRKSKKTAKDKKSKDKKNKDKKAKKDRKGSKGKKIEL
eukprot:TRINITY_DN7956_c0_g1_i1.p1 TRINITY_DN7956_c0_g1~~TRINITY_DN7956_c0_g1_i1.p1  ORF type:complete len:486 (+),score=107.12 TRINITY_DN7956_c0_g1_i1:73-1530(+)